MLSLEQLCFFIFRSVGQASTSLTSASIDISADDMTMTSSPEVVSRLYYGRSGRSSTQPITPLERTDAEGRGGQQLIRDDVDDTNDSPSTNASIADRFVSE